jgi:hypothetical protein
MKKILSLFCLLLSSLMLFAAAETKKVAILEVVDKEGKLNYSQKLMLRSSLAKAITNTQGYEAYDRTDIDAIMSEHEFQNTGMVSHDQIKQLGEMAGVSLILVAEGVLTPDNQMFVAAKILDVETAKVTMTDNTMMGLSSAEMQSGCQMLANALFGKKSKFGKKQQPQPVQQVVTQVVYQQAPQQPQFEAPAPQPQKTASACETYTIHWDINSRPQGADVFWRIISNTPEVKNQNYKYLDTTPYESTETLKIPGLTRENASSVQIEVKVEKNGYYTQKKKVSVLSLMDESDVSMMFKLVAEE